MKIFPVNTAVRTKLTVMIMLISAFVLLSISSLFVVAEIYSYRSSLEDETASLASSLAEICKKPLLTYDYPQARATLASLHLQPHVRAAFLFDEDGQPVAEYLDPSASRFILKTIPLDFSQANRSFWTVAGANQLSTNWNHLSLYMSIDHENRHVGAIYLLSDLQGLYGQLSGVAFGVLTIFGLMLVCSWYLAGRLQRPITLPLLRLVETMQSISLRQDYSLRATKAEQDEIGDLVDGFNRTLDQIELHRAELVAHQESLEQTVTERTDDLQKVVAALEVAKKQAEAASAAKSQFLASITHELRTPLIGVLGMNELLFKTDLNDQQEMLADTVQKSGENLLSLINDVLDFSKIEAGELQLDPRNFSLHQAVFEVVALLSGQAEEKGLRLYVDVDKAAAWRVRGDEGRLRQILMNLLANAIKFTEHGSVNVTLSCRDSGSEPAEFVFAISDTGIGLDELAQQRIFSTFYQADGSNTREQSGTGLGLAIVRQLVELFSGSIAVQSQPGVGSCFKVVLPLMKLAPGNFSLPARLLAQPVLLQVADSTAEQLLAAQLRGLGLKVVLAQSAADVLYQLGMAQRNARAFATVVFAANAKLPDGQPLYAAIRETASLSGLRRILLLGRKDKLALHKQEYKLYRPVAWTDLHATLTRSWHELHLVDKPQISVSDRLVVEDEVALPILLLAGGGVASRELLKLSLSGLPLRTEVAASVELLSEQLLSNCHAAILLDLQSLPLSQLLDCLHVQQNTPPIFVLHSASDTIVELEAIAAGLLRKPATSESLAQLLHPILVAAADTRNCVDGDSA